MGESDSERALAELLQENEITVTKFYRLFTALLVGMLIIHLAFSSYYVYRTVVTDATTVGLFTVFNVVSLVAEVFLSRIAFMLGSRAGQLRDMRYALAIAASQIDPFRFEAAARSIMAMRRDASALKVVDLEDIASRTVKAAAPPKSNT